VRYCNRRKNSLGVWRKECGYCKFLNSPQATTCVPCGRELVARPKRKRVLRPLDDRLARESELLDQWLTKLKVAANKVDYYRRRCRQLEKERALAEAGVRRPRAPRRPPPDRAIHVRE
jgi:hypothetical protein